MSETATIISDSTGDDGLWQVVTEATGASPTGVRLPGPLKTTTASFMVAALLATPATTVVDDAFASRVLDVSGSTVPVSAIGRSYLAQAEALTSSYLLAYVRSRFGLNMSETARILHVERPTVYSWLRGASEPRPANLDRLLQMHLLATRYSNMSEPVAQLVGTHRKTLLTILEESGPTLDEIDRLISETRTDSPTVSVRDWAARQGIDRSSLRSSVPDVPDLSFAFDPDE